MAQDRTQELDEEDYEDYDDSELGLSADADLDKPESYRAVSGFKDLVQQAETALPALPPWEPIKPATKDGGDGGAEKPAAKVDADTKAKVDQLVSDYLSRESSDEKRRASLTELEQMSKGNPSVKAAYQPMLEKLKELENARSQPETAAKLDELRTQFIVKDLGPESKPEDFKAVAERLEKEAKAGNKQAEDWRQWALVNEQVAKLSKTENLSDAQAIIKEIGKLGKEDKNPYARLALASVLAGTADAGARNNWLSTYREVNGKPVFVPNLSKITSETAPVRATIATAAAIELREVPGNGEGNWHYNDNTTGNLLKSTGASSRAEIAAVSIAISAADPKEEPFSTERRHAVQMNGGADTLALTLATTLERIIPKDATARYEAVKGIFDAIRWQVPGSEKLVVPFLNACSNHFDTWQKPPLAKTGALQSMLPDLERLALGQNKAALLVMAAIATGYADKDPAVNPKGSPPAHERARRILEEVGQRPGQRATVVELLIQMNDRPRTMYNYGYIPVDSDTSTSIFGGSHGMLTLLGSLTAGLPKDSPLIEKAKNSLLTAADTGGYPGPASASDAIRGLFAMPGLLTKADIDRLIRIRETGAEGARYNTSHLKSPEFLRGLNSAVDKMSPEVREHTISQLMKLIDESPQKDRYTREIREEAMKALGAFAKYLTKEQVEFVAGFGGDARWNRGGKPGSERLEAMGYRMASAGMPYWNFETWNGSTEAQNAHLSPDKFRAAAAEVLLRVMATAPNSADPKVDGPREIAYKAFRDVPWPIFDGKGGVVPGHNSEKLKEALIQYYDGRPFDVGLATEINRIVDSAQLPRPAGDIVWKLGIGDPKNNLDPMIRERAEKIVKNYDSATENGTEVLRRVISNIEMINTLQPYDRARLMGWTDLSDAQKQSLGWVKEPSDELKKQLNWDSLSDQQKEDIRWSGAKVDTMTVLGQMYGNELQNSANANLLKDLSSQVEAMRSGRAREVELLTNQLTNLNKKKRGEDGEGGILGDLVSTTKEGVSFGTKVVNIFNNGRDDDFARRQKEKLDALAQVNKDIAETETKLGTADRHEHQLRLAREVGEYQRLLNQGKNVEADKLAIRLWKEHGPALSQLAPGLWKDLTVSKDNTLQGACILKRLHERGLGQVDVIPGYAGGDPKKTEESLKGLRQALGLENAENSNGRVGLIQLNKNENLLDAQALRAYMMGRIDADPVLSKFSNMGREINGPMEELSKMFAAAQSGTIYENFIEVAKEKAGLIKAQMDNITEKDLRDLEGRITIMQQALSAMKGSAQSNAKAVEELESRIKTFKNMHNMLNKFDAEPKYKDVMEKTTDDSGKPINPHKNLKTMLDMVLDNGLQPSTMTTWLKQNGILIGATIAAVAATVAACATFGVASPAAVGLWVAVAGLAAREITNEVLYRVNKDGYTGWGHYGDHGSRLGHWGRQLENRTALENVIKLGTDVVGPYAVEIARDWAAFVVTAGLSNYFFGGAETAKQAMLSVFRCPPPNLAQLAVQAERAALVSQGQGTGALFMREFLKNFGRELLINSGFTGVQMGLEVPIHAALGPERLAAMGEWGQFGLSFALSTVLAMGQGALHGSQRPIFESAKMGENGRMQYKLRPGVSEAEVAAFYKRQGFDVKSLPNGGHELFPINAKPGMKPIVVENVEARGAGKPPAAVEPPGGLRQEPRPRYEGDIVVNDEFFSPTKKGEQIAVDLHAFTEKFMAKDFDGALRLARTDLPPEGNAKVTKQEVIFNGNADALVAQMRTIAKIEPPAGGEVKITAPRPVVELEVAKPGGQPGEKIKVKVDMLTGEPITEMSRTSPLKPLVEQAYAQFASSHADAIAKVRSAQESLARTLATVENHDVVWNGDARSMMEQMSSIAKVEVDGSTTKMKLPRPVVEVEIQTPSGVQKVKVDMLTGQPLEPATGQRKTQIEQAYKKFAQDNAEAITRIKAEQALILMEENLFHLRHGKDDNAPLSPTYAKFVEHCFPKDSEYTDGFRDGQKRSKATIEQEAIFALHDAGWSVEALRHHFGNHHSSVREPVFKFLEAQAAIKKLAPAVAEGVTKAINDSSTLPETRRQIYEMLPEIIRQYGSGPELVGKLEKLRDVMPSITNMGGSSHEILQTIKGLKAAYPEMVKDPIFGQVVDKEIATRIQGDRQLFDMSGFQGRMKALADAVDGVNLPADSQIKKALQSRIESMLATNKPLDASQREMLKSVATRYGLGADLVGRINSYDPAGKPPKTEILNRDIADAFVERDPGRRTKSFDEFWKKMGGDEANGLSGHFKKPDDIYAHFGKGGTGKRGAELVKGSDNLYVIDVGGNNYRVLVKFDFATGTATIKWAGTHGQYDSINPINYN